MRPQYLIGGTVRTSLNFCQNYSLTTTIFITVHQFIILLVRNWWRASVATATTPVLRFLAQHFSHWKSALCALGSYSIQHFNHQWYHVYMYFWAMKTSYKSTQCDLSLFIHSVLLGSLLQLLLVWCQQLMTHSSVQTWPQKSHLGDNGRSLLCY